ncbi:MAG: DUF4097 family beta strand repeat protein [Clostridia bacterium]|nr:DUF4097 family beta strand repeat protein [Clostridia bacterium]
MKKLFRILIVIALCLVLVAIYLPGAFSFIGYHYDDAGRYSSGDCTIDKKVKNIDIDWIAGQVNIALHDSDDIILTETANRKMKDAEKVHWLLDDNTLYVKYGRSGRINFSNLNKELTLLLPESMNLDEVQVSSVSAHVNAELAESDCVDIHSVSGTAKVTLHRAETVKTDTVSGDMLLCFAKEPDSIKANSVSGSVTVQLPKGTGFTADMDSVSGRISGDMLGNTDDSKNYTRGNGDCDIQMNSVSGDLTLDEYNR